MVKASIDSLSVETSIVGSLLISPELTGQVLTQINAEDFSNFQCLTIFQAIQSLYYENLPIDAVTVADRLSSLPEIRQDLMTILKSTPSAQNIFAYIDILKEQSRLRRLRDCATKLLECPSLDDAQPIVSQANGVFNSRQGVSRLSATDLIADFWNRHNPEKKTDYLDWGLPKLEGKLYTEPGDFILIGGYPSAGKTALALRFAWHIAKSKRVGFYSLETSQAKLADRSIAALAAVEMGRIKSNQFSQYDKVSINSLNIAHRSLELVHGAGMSVQDIQSDALANRYEVIFIDYAQLIMTPGIHNRVEAVTSISLGLHQMAQSNGITVVALSQLSRAEKSKNGAAVAPTMSSLRESGQLEQDADAIMLLYAEHPDMPMDGGRILKIAKNKEGSLGRIRLHLDGKTQTFTEEDTIHTDEPQHKQVKFTEIEGTDDDLPF